MSQPPDSGGKGPPQGAKPQTVGQLPTPAAGTAAFPPGPPRTPTGSQPAAPQRPPTGPQPPMAGHPQATRPITGPNPAMPQRPGAPGTPSAVGARSVPMTQGQRPTATGLPPIRPGVAPIVPGMASPDERTNPEGVTIPGRTAARPAAPPIAPGMAPPKERSGPVVVPGMAPATERSGPVIIPGRAPPEERTLPGGIPRPQVPVIAAVPAIPSLVPASKAAPTIAPIVPPIAPRAVAPAVPAIPKVAPAAPAATPPPPPAEAAAADTDALLTLDQRHAAMDQSDYFEILQLPKEATPGDIKKAFYRESRALHPDRFYQLKDKGLKERVNELYKRITEAYYVLRDDTKRKRYLGEVTGPERAKKLRFTDASEAETKAAAKKEADEEIGKHPKARGFYTSAMSDMEGERWQSAERNLKMALTYEPSNARYKERLAEVQKKMDSGRSKDDAFKIK